MAATPPTTIPAIVPLFKMMPDDGCVDSVSAAELASRCVVDEGAGVSAGVRTVVWVDCVADELVYVEDVVDDDCADFEVDWSEVCED